ncbi:M1 family aminopeptidase [Altibacter sp. HG106]|uniref:M1 family aminopeptidase n=1 Tax=Altibacter sp. HG106 TaxID=3023937 RepID=UPI00234FC990|nr:M1 family metallopeptidase [Altibacter sp. HG106]MDC7993876.1 M1 family metallopeptidase [Altibacter sp. HG106]
MKYLLLTLFLCIATPFWAQVSTVDVENITATIEPKAETKSVTGTVTVTFQLLKDASEVRLDAVNMTLLDFDSEEMTITAEDKAIVFRSDFKKGASYTTSFRYRAVPKQTLYFTGDQIWTQGQGKYTSHWLPSVDDMNDKIEFDLTIVAPNDQEVMANGALLSREAIHDKIGWKYDMTHPMASYLVAFVMGNFDITTLRSESGVPISLFYRQEDAKKAKATYRHSEELFNFLEEKIGVAYPWQNYKQAPVRDFLYAGMENTTATIFSEAFVVDEIGFNDRNYVNVNAHELAHQWFGNLVTETSGAHHWLQEGFATYYALLAEREIFGEDYYYWKLYNTAEQLKEASDQGKGQRLLDPNASSLTFYEKGAWALHILEELIGSAAFDRAVQSYLTKYAYANVTTSDFLEAVREETSVDIASWEKDWLQQTAFKAEQAYQSLMKSAFMESYFEIAALRSLPWEDKKALLEGALIFPNDFIGQEAIYQLASEPIEKALPLYKKGFDSNNLFVRQAIASSLERIPAELRERYEGLLKDDSYVTQEIALYQLWAQFPEQRKTYLDQMKGVEGFQDKNIRQLWLALALATETYEPEATEAFKNELRSYATKEYSFEIRQKAFQYINELQLYNEGVIESIINACTHPNWRFRSEARNLLGELLKSPGLKEALLETRTSFPPAERAYLDRVLE